MIEVGYRLSTFKLNYYISYQKENQLDFIVIELENQDTKLFKEFRKISNDKSVYTQNINSKINSLHLTVHKDGFLLNRRKIQKIEYIKYVIKKFFIKI